MAEQSSVCSLDGPDRAAAALDRACARRRSWRRIGAGSASSSRCRRNTSFSRRRRPSRWRCGFGTAFFVRWVAEAALAEPAPPRSARAARCPARAAHSRLHRRQQGRAGGARDPDPWLRHTRDDADGFPELAELLHRRFSSPRSLVFTTLASRAFGDNRSAFIGLMVLGTMFVVASLHVKGFLSGANIKSMLVFASFLGLATVGQTLVALLGGLDLSIPFVIGSSNVGLLYLIGLGVPSPIAVILVLVIGGVDRFPQRRPELPAAGTGADRHARHRLRDVRAHADPHQHRVCLRRQRVRRGAALAQQPRRHERRDLRARDPAGHLRLDRGRRSSLIVGMKNTVYGRYLYALGGNRTSAQRILISERRYWFGAFTISGFASALTGSSAARAGAAAASSASASRISS